MRFKIGTYAPEGKSILAQVTKDMRDRGVVIYTFWWNNTATRIDAFGNYKKFTYRNRQEMRGAYASLKAAGYAAVAS